MFMFKKYAKVAGLPPGIIRAVSYEYRNIEYLIVKDDRRKPKEVKPIREENRLPLDEFADRFVEPVVRSIPEQKRLLVISPLIEVVPQFVMYRRKVIRVHLDAHFDPQIVDVIYIPGRRVTHHIAIPRMHKLRALPERGR